MDDDDAGRNFCDLRMMLLDSDDFAISLFKSVASSLGIHNVETYQSTKAVVTKIRMSGAPDLLFVRLKRVDGDALEIFRLIRSRDGFPFPYVPIVAVMEHPTVKSVTAARDAGADEFLGCPFSPQSMAQRINAILQDRRGFVDASGYFGPDRRRGAIARWLGDERRSDLTELIDPVTEEVYMG